MKFVELNDMAESLAEYIEDMQLKVVNNKPYIMFVKNSENWTNLNDWLIDADVENVKIEYNKNYVKLFLS